MRRLTILLLTVLAGVAWSDDGVDIAEPDKVAVLTELQEKVDTISAAVTACISSGSDHGDCLCENEELILDFNRSVEALFEAYPDLETLDLVNFKSSNGVSVSQSLSGIRKQAEMELGCT